MNNTRFKDGRLGIGRTPIFPLDVSGNTRIEGDLVLKGTIADGSGVPIYFGHAGVTSTDGSNNNYHIGINKAAATDANFPLDVEGNININNGNLFINGDVAEFSNWTDIGETEESGIYRNTKVAIGKTTANHILDVSGTVNIDGDILINGTTMDPNPSVPPLQDYTDTGPTWKDATIITTVASSSAAESSNQALTASIDNKADKASPEFSGNVGIGKTADVNYALDILGDVNISSGALKLNGQIPVYSNWQVSGDDIFRDSGVTIGQNSVNNTSYKLYVNGDSHVQGTLSATTLSGSLPYTSLTGTPTTIDSSQSSAIVTNTGKVSSQWITGSSSKIYYNSGNVGIGTTSPKEKLDINAGKICFTGGSFDETTGISYYYKNHTTERKIMFFNGSLVFRSPWDNSAINNSGRGIFFQQYDGTNIMHLRGDNGNVGIGTTSPTELLTVGNNSTSNTGGTTSMAILGPGENADAILYFGTQQQANGASGNAKKAAIIAEGITSYSRSKLHFCLDNTENNSSTYNASLSNSRMTIQYDGNVGIGTTSPIGMLSVGDSNVSGSDGNIVIGKNNGSGGTRHLKLGWNSTFDFCFGDYGSDNSASTWVESFKMSYQAPANSLVIDSVGNVGIGTNSPDTKLHVNGGKLLITETYNGYSGGKILGGSSDNAHAIHFRVGEDGTTDVLDFHEYGKIRFYTNGLLAAQTEKMCILSNGNVGIGITDPASPLEIQCTQSSSTDSSTQWNGAKGLRLARWYNHSGQTNSSQYAWEIVNGWHNDLLFRNINSNGTVYRDNVLVLDDNGNVGIGTDSPSKAKLHVEGTGPLQSNFVARYYNSSGAGNSSGSNRYFSAYFTHHIACQELQVFSDRRIKENIVDVSDNQALSMLRDIPCRYYEYRDKISKGDGKTIGFIAQEVKEVLPLAVSVMKDVIPNEMRNLENISWEEIIDGSNNKYKLTSDLSDCSGINYQFYVSNDPSGNDECKKEIIGNSDDTFTFEKKWNNVFCYGKEVDDFHTLDKNKLFALNFSATQELDKKVMVLESENAELKNKVANLEAKLQSIEQRLAFAGF
tara:strand:- start:746 stop:3925 length:3180 start_codon:yes stop_codon:yes gene_type:complete